MKTKMSRICKKSISLVLTVMLLLSTLAIGITSVSAAVSSETATIYVYSTSSTPKIWAWSDDYTASNFVGTSTWTDRPSMTSAGTNLYSYELSVSAQYVIFTYGSNDTQTSDITLPSDWSTNPVIYNTYSSLDSVGLYYYDVENTSLIDIYYISGRFRVKSSEDATDYKYTYSSGNDWEESSTNISFNYSGSGLYTLNTYCTVSELSQSIGSTSYIGSPLFYLYDGISAYYQPSSDVAFDDYSSSSNALSLVSSTTRSHCTYFNNTSDTSTDLVTIYFDSSAEKLWYEAGSSTTAGAYKLSDKSDDNGSVTFANNTSTDLTSGTANAGDTITVTVTPNDGYLFGDDFSLTVAGKTTSTDYTTYCVVKNDGTDSKTYEFVVPDVSTTETGFNFTATGFTFDKASYVAGTSQLYLDADPSNEVNSSATLIARNKYTGSSHGTNSYYTFYAPADIDLSNAVIWNDYDSDVTLKGITISAGSSATVSLTAGETYTPSGATTTQIYVMQGSTDSLYISQSSSLPTTTDSSLTTKDSVKITGGEYVTLQDGEYSSSTIKQVKGRGNSSWEASYEIFGKYAFNMKLDTKTNLFGMSTSKNWCLLANNADESMLRNALTYDLADALGLNSPDYAFVDIYDNGEYMGQYLVTSKVDVGKNDLVKGTSIDDINEDAAIAEGLEEVDETTNYGTYTYKGSSYDMKYATVCTDTSSIDYSSGTFLLEFEISDRYDDEASWFISPQGQIIVVKSPEFATKEEVQYIAEKFAEMEALAYADSSDTYLSDLSEYMDLDSFAKMYLIQELSANLDSAATSYYITFDCSAGDDARMVASPVWDYDWAYGQYGTKSDNSNAKYDVNGNVLDPSDVDAWYSRNKNQGDSSTQSSAYSLQSKLANNSSFMSVIKKVWNGSDTTQGFYDIVQNYYGTDSQIDAWYNEISASVAMNEARWDFIASDPLVTASWGSLDTGDTLVDTVNYLENTWTAVRAAWLENQINNIDSTYKTLSYSQFAAPTLTASYSDTTLAEGESATDVATGTTVTLTADTTETYVTYQFYNGDTLLGTNTTGSYEVTLDTAGTYTYTVKTVYEDEANSVSDTSNASGIITITASGDDTPTISSVSLTNNTSTVTAGGTISFTATVDNADATCTYTLYQASSASEDGTAVVTDSTSANLTVTAPSTAGTYYYYVVATDSDGNTATSTPIAVTVQAGAGDDDSKLITVYFKSSSTSMYVPSVTLNGTTYDMTKVTRLGKSYDGTMVFYWYSATLTVDTTSQNTVTFTTAGTDMKASYSSYFSTDDTEYYFAVEDLVDGTKVVDLTDSAEYIQNYFHSARHMVMGSDTTKINGTLGYTRIDGVMYRMGSSLSDPSADTLTEAASTATVSVVSATLAQKLAVGATSTSTLQAQLLDVNGDGTVNVADSTLIQKAVAKS